MKNIIGLVFFLCFTHQAFSSDLAATCAALQLQLSKLDSESKAMLQEQMAPIIDMCKEEDTEPHKDSMTTGTLYCKSGDLCAKYDFAYPSDRKLYESSCAQVSNCSSNYSDKCSLSNDKVRNGRGTVDWTIYAYNGLVRDQAKNLNCN
jgi:hypothetical protein